jgi:hypothetical protein
MTTRPANKHIALNFMLGEKMFKTEFKIFQDLLQHSPEGEVELVVIINVWLDEYTDAHTGHTQHTYCETISHVKHLTGRSEMKIKSDFWKHKP